MLRTLALAALLTPQIQAALIGAVATVVIATLGVLVVVWQIGKQARLTIKATQHTEALKLKLKVYEAINDACRDASSAASEEFSYIQSFQMDVRLHRTVTPWPVPEARTPILLEKPKVLSKNAIELIRLVETWETIDLRIQVFKMAFSSALQTINAAFSSYFETASRVIPQEIPGHEQQGTLYPWLPPDDQTFERLETRWNSLSDALMDFQSYILDFRVEMQNLLLGELFDHKIQPRQPGDPDVIVVRLDRYQELTTHFEQEEVNRQKNP